MITTRCGLNSGSPAVSLAVVYQRPKRLLKEHQSYRKEVEEQNIKVNKLVADGAEEWDIKNAVSFNNFLLALLQT